MDNFEKHIKENKHLFDGHKADRSKMWAEIESRLPNAKPKAIRLWQHPLYRIAASVLLIVGLFSTVIFFTNGGVNYNQENNIVNKELQEINMHYKSLVSHQVQLVKNHPDLSEEDKHEFLSFMDELDDEYLVLKIEMEKNLDNELVLEAIVSNYKKRIELIEKLLHQINRSKKTDNSDGYIL